MPNIKHHFRAGRMNKDLDERLVPNGEYRDAQNIEIVTSEGSNVGSIQNVLGNTLKDGRIYDENPKLKVFKSLLNPHKSYLKEILKLKESGIKIGGLCHITGGGFYDNIPRVLSENLSVELNLEIKSPFRELGEATGISLRELLTVFNCGYGMLVFVAPEFKEQMNYELLGVVKHRRNGESVIVNCN